ncbi:MAG: hypothetical protein WC712_04395 [Candidatus Brocadiia bacterium]
MRIGPKAEGRRLEERKEILTSMYRMKRIGEQQIEPCEALSTKTFYIDSQDSMIAAELHGL